ncbi:lipopolysaccharide-induced tumor necrosis factor-alpha factor homolog isoform X6 [Biomphalaria glabrata]|uniref:Lipopolysaccharide-induced tumor necrosis factor-alpha factor homolog isoform X6 n=1 Tax=Biomphalaria glabrata TaxID=6526 RepID=A0A9W2ZJD2_BIOGL|nr:lipopolysaccharide-induced tumor necrosis factor-alpha factor homolog isoform X6 [Biomphalaria glabrata]
MSEMSSTNMPPPYPGPPVESGQSQNPPPNLGYPAQFDASKTTQAPGYPPAPGYPAPPPPQSFYAWPGYGQPNQPGIGYGQPYSMPANYRQGTTVVVAQPPITVVQTFRDVPVHMNCPHCRAEIVTGTHYETGTFTWIICFVLFFVGCSLGCCFFPFCVDGCKDVIHTCPNCRQQLARYSRI